MTCLIDVYSLDWKVSTNRRFRGLISSELFVYKNGDHLHRQPPLPDFYLKIILKFQF